MSKRNSPPPCACLPRPSSLHRRQELQHLRCDCLVEDQLWSSCPSSWARPTSQFTGQRFPAGWYLMLPSFPHIMYVISAGVCAAAPMFKPRTLPLFCEDLVPFQGCLRTCGNQLWLPENHVSFLKALENTEAQTLLKSESP